MIHARRDYQNLKALDLKIPDKEPVFLLRAQDATAAEVVRYWASLQNNPLLKVVAEQHAKLMDSWPIKKDADVPEEEINYNMTMIELPAVEEEPEDIEEVAEEDEMDLLTELPVNDSLEDNPVGTPEEEEEDFVEEDEEEDEDEEEIEEIEEDKEF